MNKNKERYFRIIKHQIYLNSTSKENKRKSNTKYVCQRKLDMIMK